MAFKPLMIAGLVSVLAGCLDEASTAQSGSTATAAPAASGSGCAPAGVAANAAQIVGLINQERQKAGLAPVAVSGAATGAAQAYACQISARRDIGHIGPDGSNVADRLGRVGISVSSVAENTAEGFTTPDKTFAAWMASSGHRRNILTPEMTLVGVGQAVGSYPTWVLDLYAPG